MLTAKVIVIITPARKGPFRVYICAWMGQREMKRNIYINLYTMKYLTGPMFDAGHVHIAYNSPGLFTAHPPALYRLGNGLCMCLVCKTTFEGAEREFRMHWLYGKIHNPEDDPMNCCQQCRYVGTTRSECITHIQHTCMYYVSIFINVTGLFILVYSSLYSPFAIYSSRSAEGALEIPPWGEVLQM